MATLPFQPTAASNFGRAAVVTLDTAFTSRALYVGVSGDITGIPAGQDNAVLFKAVPVGIFNVAMTQVNTSGTTAENMLALS
jgi:hypothetical protein